MVKRKRQAVVEMEPKNSAPANSDITVDEGAKERQRVVDDLSKTIEGLQFIVNGLENHEPYRRLIEIYQENILVADDSWHLAVDQKQLEDIRIKKLAAELIVKEIPTIKQSIKRLQEELVKMQNPNEFVLRDYEE